MARISDFSLMLFPWGVKNPSPQEILQAARLAEDLGFYSVSLPQHLTLPTSWLFRDFPNQDVLDPLVLLPAMAAATSKIKVGPNSVILPLLPPYQWAKYLATLDVMTGGRAIAGAAMGWWEEEFAVVEADRSHRGKLFDEQLEIITRLWTQKKVTFNGRHYHIKDAPLEPKPLQKPYPPIWLGGGQKSIPRAARYADYLVPFWPSPQEVKDIYLPKLEEEGAKWGRQCRMATFSFAFVARDDAEYQAMLPRLRECVAFEDPATDPSTAAIAGVPAQCAQRIWELEEAGISHFLIEFQFHGLETVPFMMRQMETFAQKVVPLLK